MKAPTCPRCQSVYVLKSREFGHHGKQPFLLHCGHSFCETCLQKLPRKRDSISCPTCQMATKAPSGIPLHKPLSLDIYILGLMWAKRLALEHQADKMRDDEGPKQKKKDPKNAKKTGAICAECKIHAASCECRQCECIMCKQCFDKIHKMSVSLQRHQALPYFAASQERSSFMKTRSRTCLVHENCQIEYFCKEDNKPICSRCVIMGDHKGHDVQTMEDKNRDTLSHIEPAIQLAQETVWRLNKAEKSLTEALPLAKRDTKDLEEELRLHFQELHSLLQAREEQLMDEIKTVATSAGDIIQEMKMYVLEEKSMLEAAIQDGLRTMQGSIHRLVDADLVLERLQHASEVSSVVKCVDGGEANKHIRFTHEEFQSLRESILKYGSIAATSSPQTFELRLPDPDDEKPLPEELQLPSALDLDTLSYTDTESVTDSASVIVEEEKEDICGAVEVEPRKATYPPLKPMLPGHCEIVRVTHIRTPGQFFVQQISKIAELEALSRQLNSYCRSASAKKETVDVLAPGDRVLAQFSHDKKWYRAVVNSIIPAEESSIGKRQFSVFYIDYGNSEVTTLKSLRRAHRNFFVAPSFALECALRDIVPSDEQQGWSRDSVEMMLEMTQAGHMMMTVFDQVAGVLEVDLSSCETDKQYSDDRPVSVRDSLVFLETAIFSSGSLATTFPGRTKRDFLTLPRIQEGTLLDIIVTSVLSPHALYAQHLRSTDLYLNSVEQRMQELYGYEAQGLYTVFCPKKGMICAAQFSRDHRWYRARILDLMSGRMVLVQYVDYGNTEVIHHTRIRKILDDDIKLPAQAISCCLCDVEPADGSKEWSEEAKAWLTRHVNQRVCQFRVTTESTKSNAMIGALYCLDPDNGRLMCVNSELVQHGFALSTGEWSQSSKSETFDGVTLASQQQTHLLQVQGADIAGAAAAVPSQVMTAPSVSPTKMSSPSPKSSHMTSPFHASAAGKMRRGDFHKRDGNKAKDASRTAKKKAVPSPEPKCHAAGDAVQPTIHSVAVKISDYQSPGHFYIQLLAKSEELESMMEQLLEYDDTNQTDKEWKVGDYCAARCSKDQRWYRGHVRGVLEDGSMEVVLVDYGFTDTLPSAELRPLLKKHGKNECFAERCHLAGILSAGSSDPSKWTSTAKEFMTKHVGQGKQLFVKLEGEAVPGLGLPVDILIEEIVPETAFDPPSMKYMSMIDLLLGQGLALPMKGKKRSAAAAKTDSGIREECFHAKVTVAPASPEKSDSEDIPETDDPVNPVEENEIVIVQPDLDIAPHPPPATSTITVIPIYVDYTGVIFAHDVAEEEKLTKLIEHIDNYARHEAPSGRLEVQPGQICLAHYFADNVWYRARVLEVNADDVKVKYVDFGNMARVSRDKLKLATPDICRLPQLGYQLVLHNVRSNTVDWMWPTPVLEYIHAEIVNYRCIAEVKVSPPENQGENDGLKAEVEVDLKLSDGRILSKILLDMGVVVLINGLEDLYQRADEITHILKHSNPYFSVHLGEVGDTVPVLVTHLDLPNLIYLQRFTFELDAPASEDASTSLTAVRKSLSEFVSLMDDLNNLPPQTPSFSELPGAGEMCCAKYSLDNRWYRGLVVNIYPASKTALIFYVDYGNSEIVDLQGLRVLPQRFQDTEAQAVRACLNIGLPEGHNHWTAETYKAMAEAIYMKVHWAKLKSMDPLSVELYMEDPVQTTSFLAYQSLIKEGLVISPTCIVQECDGTKDIEDVFVECEDVSDN